jgi:hypothetical protein
METDDNSETTENNSVPRDAAVCTHPSINQSKPTSVRESKAASMPM